MQVVSRLPVVETPAHGCGRFRDATPSQSRRTSIKSRENKAIDNSAGRRPSRAKPTLSSISLTEISYTLYKERELCDAPCFRRARVTLCSQARRAQSSSELPLCIERDRLCRRFRRQSAPGDWLRPVGQFHFEFCNRCRSTALAKPSSSDEAVLYVAAAFTSSLA